MKHTLIILALITATIQTFAQSPRIKLNQITKDSITGSVLISSPTDSGMVYSRDLFISYGADTFLILGGDTLAATSSIISSVLSDGVTITGDGTLGSELTVDTATVIATKGDLDLYYLDSNPDGYTSNTGTVTSVAATAGTGISVSGSPITTSGTLTITNTAPDQTVSIAGGGINAVSGTYPSFTVTGTEVDGSVTNEGSLTVGAGGANDAVISSNTSGSSDVTISGGTNVTVTESGQTITISSTGGGGSYNNISETADTVYISNYLDVDTATLYVDANNNKIGIGTSSPQDKLHIAGTTQMEFSAGTKYKFDLRGDGVINLYNLTSGQSSGLEFYSQDGDGTDFVSLTIFGNQDFTSTGTLTNYSRLINLFYPGTGYVVGTDASGVAKSKLYFNTTGLTNPNLVIDTLGAVGIGTSSPSYKLDVNGNVRADTYYYDVTSTLQSSSDSRLKQNITDMDNVLDKLKELELVKYEWNDNMYKKLEGRTSQSKLGGTFEGMIAQQVESLFPQYVGEDADGYKTLSYVSFVIPLLKGFQEQQAIIESQASEIEQLKSQIQLILSEIEQIKNN